MSLVARLRRPGPSGFGYASTADEVTAGVDVSGRTIVVTGCSSGLGRETLRVLAKRGARVIATARTADKAEATCRGVAPGAHSLACDLANPSSVRACAEAVRNGFEPLHAIVCNAGIMALPRLEQAFGYELQFFTNHVGHFLLVTNLLSRLATDGRVVVVSSTAHERAPKSGIELDNLSGERGYRPWVAYGQSKLANLLFARALAHRLGGAQTSNALHPGVIRTELARSMSPVVRTALRWSEPIFLKSVAQGAATQCYVATHPDLRATGEYFADCNVARSSALGRDTELGERLWAKSEEIVRDLP